MQILPEMYCIFWLGRTDKNFWKSSASRSGSRNFLKA